MYLIGLQTQKIMVLNYFDRFYLKMCTKIFTVKKCTAFLNRYHVISFIIGVGLRLKVQRYNKERVIRHFEISIFSDDVIGALSLYHIRHLYLAHFYNNVYILHIYKINHIYIKHLKLVHVHNPLLCFNIVIKSLDLESHTRLLLLLPKYVHVQ